MKKLIMMMAIMICFVTMFGQGVYENDGKYSDTIKIFRETSLLPSPQTIYVNEDESLKIPKDEILISKHFSNGYYTVEFNGNLGYVFCLDVQTPNRIRKQQLWLQLTIPDLMICYVEDFKTKSLLISHNDNVYKYFSSGCIYEIDEIKINEFRQSYNSLYTLHIPYFKLSEPTIGMSRNNVLCNFGEPILINKTVGSFGVHEQFVYDKMYIYVENNIVTSFQTIN